VYAFGQHVRFWRLKPYFAPPFALDHHQADSDVVTLSIPGYRQARSYSCGYASVLMVARYFVPELRALDLYERLGTDSDGTRQNAIIRELRCAGVSVGVRYDMSFDILCKSIDLGKPVIAYLGDAEHWLVLYGYGRNPDRVFVADPRPGHRCEELWRDYGRRLNNFGIMCSRRHSHPDAVQLDEDQPENANSQLSLAFSSEAASSEG
jgi:ABC-type bacteriocin/lantibiotic exporter with double-glycine peptidase domain